MLPDKKQLEILLMHYFRVTYQDFPKGRLRASESPDFLMRMKNRRRLGIELTRLNPGNADLPNEEKIKEIDVRNQLIQFTLELFQQKSGINLFVKFLFSQNIKLVRERELDMAVRMSGLIWQAVEKKGRSSFFQTRIEDQNLPDGVEEILIVYHPKLKMPVWERSNNLGISNDVLDDIRNAIKKKDEKLRLYHKNHLNYYWLLITTDRLRGVKNYNLVNKVMNHQFHSHFQHVFLFDLIKSRIFELV